MGLLDFLFGRKSEKERQEKERHAEQERLRLAEEKRIAEEREKRLADNKRKEEARLAKLKEQREAENEKKGLDMDSITICGHKVVIDPADLKIDQEALIAYESKDYQTAIAKYSILIEKNKEAFQYYKFRGTVYEDMGDDNFAFRDFSKAVELCPTDAIALYRLGMVYYRRKDIEKAITYLEKANKHMPSYDNYMGNVYNNMLFVHKRVIVGNLANFLIQCNRIEDGLKLLNEVITNCPDYSFPYFVKAVVLVNQGDFKNAVSCAKKAKELGYPQADILLAQINAQLSGSNSKDRYAEMVDNASFNPFNITTDRALQNTSQLPDLKSVFINELSKSFSMLSEHMDELNILTSYIFNLAESYYNNAGYIPKNTLDEIIESVYSAYQSTIYYNSSVTLDKIKYQIYYNLLNR